MRCFRLLPVVILAVVPLCIAVSPTPYVNQPLVPSRAFPGQKGFVVTINGSGFIEGAVVNWNGNPLMTRFVNHNQLKAFVPPADVAEAGTASVTVANPENQNFFELSNPVPFTVTRPTPSLTFEASTLAVGTSVTALTAADFNHDGKMDLAVGNIGTSNYECTGEDGQGHAYITMLLGNGDGTFNVAQNIEADCGDLGGNVLSETVGDFNNDGFPDLVFTLSGGGDDPAVSVHLGNGDGTFANIPSFIENCCDGLGTNVVTGDFNADGFLDLAFPVVIFDFDELFYYQGSGNGTFTQGEASYNEMGGIPGWLAEGDFNGDGILDIAMYPSNGQQVIILLGNGDGTLSLAPTQPNTTLVSSQFAAVADFNGDGILDIAFADSGSTALTVLLGNGDGTFTQKMGETDIGQTTTYVTTADLNGDGKLDLILVGSADSILILLGNGDGTFQTPLAVPGGPGASQVAIGDFYGNGRLDLAVSDTASNTVTLLMQSPAAIPSHSSVDFGRQKMNTQSLPRCVKLTNNGSAPLTIKSIVASGDFSQWNDCGTRLETRHSCGISVVFQPTETGLRTGSITISDNAADNPQVITLSGIGD